MGMKFPSLNFKAMAGGLSSERGQGMIEYILLVVVIITMALAIGARLFKPFNEWANHYIGDYVVCLLDYGELPSLGGAEAFSDGECDKKFEPFTVAGGRGEKEDSKKAKEKQANSSSSSGNRRSDSRTVA